KADVYDKYRPSYPAELIDWIYEKTHAETVADVGAGTGIFTKCLSLKPWIITAVEPNGDMLEKLRGNVSGIEIINAPAENTGIASASIDLVTAAQAFHWFDREKFKAECMRILAPNGRLAVVWNKRLKCGFSAGRDEVCVKYCGMCHRDGSTEDDLFLGDEYFGGVEHFCADNIISMDEERFLGDMFSRSYSLKESDENYPQFVDGLRNVFAKYENGGRVEVPYETSCYLGKF
ncbi:MAG: class I SAM-dependent methyltransferase, partial [Muribaculaceae bacterium]|nr:class I SAM-dependent methyltransferase [Muribaculaceae bacterium]